MNIGIDEVGRGCLAGPISAVAFCLRPGCTMPDGVKDSKLLSLKKREFLYEKLIEVGYWGYGEVGPQELDEIGINPANKKAMVLAYEAMLEQSGLSRSKAFVVVDGTIVPEINAHEVRSVIDADATHPEVSAASIIAKVIRDRLMRIYAKVYPGYGFETNAGYGSAVHMKGIRENGGCRIHRQSFAPFKQKTKKINT